jgi:hypothetical protein
MRRAIAIGLLVLISGSAADSAGTTNIDIDLPFSSIAHGAVIAFPFTDLPEGWTQGGLMGVSGLSNPGLGGGAGFFTIPPQDFLAADPATIRWAWFGGGNQPLLSITYYICSTPTPCPRPKAGFHFKTKSVAIGVRG